MEAEFHIFIAVAEDCPPCIRFDQEEYPAIQNEFGKDKISIIPFVRRQDLIDPEKVRRFQSIKNDPDKHPQVTNVRWTPTIGVVTKKSWDNKDGVLKGFVYGGELIEKDGENVFIRKKNETFLVEANAIIQWIKDKLENDPLFLRKNYREIKTLQPQMRMFGSNIKFRSRDILQD